MDIDDGRVISNFIVQALREKDLTIFGDGSQTRCFCYVDDLVTGMLNLMNTPNDITGPVNVGSNNEMTILSIADEIIKITGTKSKIKFLDPVVDDPKQRKPDLTLAKKIIDWNPKINLESGLIKTIEYFKSVI